MEKIISGQNLNLAEEEKEKMFERVSGTYARFLEALGYDWANDPNMVGTPDRVAKMYLKETTTGSYDSLPKITSFKNQQRYGGMVLEEGVEVKSLCSHHMMPFFGSASIAYIPGKDMIGLSKINRIVDHYSRRPQLQEQLTQQIHDEICKQMPDNQGVAVYIDCLHTCVFLRGVNQKSNTKTAIMSGAFEENEDNARSEFYSMIKK